MLPELYLTPEQRSIIVLCEIEFQLTIMKQYLSVEETKAYLLLLNKYGSLRDREYVISQYNKAWGDTLDV